MRLFRPLLATLTSVFFAAGCSAAATSSDDSDRPGAISARDDSGSSAGDEAFAPDAGAGEASDAATAHDSAVLDASSSGDASLPHDGDAGVDAPIDAPPDVPPPSLDFDCSGEDGGSDQLPNDLACTGLYANWPNKIVAASARAFAPAVSLWSDGAEKSRFIALPPGTKIDTSDMNEWSFPVGTKVWKEFRLNGVRVETRYLYKRASGWLRTTYAWQKDQSSAKRLAGGMQNVWGTGYEIPSESACTTCHQGRVDFVLGFEAVGLSMSGAQGLTMNALVSEGLVTAAPSSPIAIPGDATAQAALAWLHANCGTACHSPSPSAYAGRTGFFMRLDVNKLASVQATDTYSTGAGVVSNFQTSGSSNYQRIAPGDVTHSAIVFRAGYRDTQGEDYQMPPIDSHAVDANDVATLKAWVTALK